MISLDELTEFESTGYLVLGFLIIGVIVYVAYELPNAASQTTPADYAGAVETALTAGIYGPGSWTGWGS